MVILYIFVSHHWHNNNWEKINFVSLWKSFKYYDINRIINITYNNKKGIDKSIEEKRCLLCNKPYDYKYKMFGRVCLDNIYGILDFHKLPKFVWNKEAYLCTKIAWKNHKGFSKYRLGKDR